MKSDDYKPRFSFEITEEQFARSERYLSAHGVKKALFGIILDDVLDKIELHGEKFIIAMTANLVKPTDLLRTTRKVDELIKGMEEKDDMP
jgi:hypothetical protein